MHNNYCTYCMTLLTDSGNCPKCGLTAGKYMPQAHHLPPGTMLLDRYLVGRVLGEGGFGITYIGRDTRLDLKVAIKEYFPRDRAVRNSAASLEITGFVGDPLRAESYERGKRKFLQEARTIALMEKQQVIVSVRDFFEINNTAYIVMEYIEGTTLSALTSQRGGRIAPSELFPMIEPLFEALSEFHSMGLIHRDISPDNLMLEKGSIRLLDFGCAREAANGTETMTITLKHCYAPMEQYQRKGQGPWTDIYSLAATIYFCLTGSAPPQALERIGVDEIILPSKIGVDLTTKQEAALLKALDPKPKRRYQNIMEMWAGLYKNEDEIVTPDPDPDPEPEPENDPEPDNGTTHDNEKKTTEESVIVTGEVEEHKIITAEQESQKDSDKDTDGVTGDKKQKERSRRKKIMIGLISAASAAALLIIIGVIMAVNSGKNIEAEPASKPISGTSYSSDTAESGQDNEPQPQIRTGDEAGIIYTDQMLDELYAEAVQFSGNAEDPDGSRFKELLEDDSVKAIVLTGASSLMNYTVNKPLFIGKNVETNASSLEITGTGCLVVYGKFETEYLRLHGSGQKVFVRDGGKYSVYYESLILCDDEANIRREDTDFYDPYNIKTNYPEIIADKKVFENDAVTVRTKQEFAEAVKGDKPIVIDAALDLDELTGNSDYLYSVDVPVKIAAGASLSCNNGAGYWDVRGMLKFGEKSYLINDGSLKCSIILDGTLINNGTTDNGYYVKCCNNARIINYGEFGHGTLPAVDADISISILSFVNLGRYYLDQNTGFSILKHRALNNGKIDIHGEFAIDGDSFFMNNGNINVLEGSFINCGILDNRGGSKFTAADGTLFRNTLMRCAYGSLDIGKVTVVEEGIAVCAGNEAESLALPDNICVKSYGLVYDTQRSVGTKEEFKAALEDNSVKAINVTSDLVIDEDITITKDVRLSAYLTMTGGAKLTIIDSVLFSDAQAKNGDFTLMKVKDLEMHNSSLSLMHGFHTLGIETGANILLDNSFIFGRLDNVSDGGMNVTLRNNSALTDMDPMYRFGSGTRITVESGSRIVLPSRNTCSVDGTFITADDGLVVLGGELFLNNSTVDAVNGGRVVTSGGSLTLDNSKINIDELSSLTSLDIGIHLSSQSEIVNNGRFDLSLRWPDGSSNINYGSQIVNNGNMNMYLAYMLSGGEGCIMNNGTLHTDMPEEKRDLIAGSGKIES